MSMPVSIFDTGLRGPCSRRAVLGAGIATGLVGRASLAAPSDPRWVLPRILPHEARRQDLTRAYLAAHLPKDHPHDPQVVHMTPRAIVLHWTGSSSSNGVWNTFASATLSGRPELQGAGALNVGVPFLVERDGICWRLLPDTRICRHVIGLNHCAIGIENTADGPLGGDSRAPLTRAQVDRNSVLVRLLVERYPTIRWLLGHHEYRKMEATPLFAERDPTYRTTKIDPGAAFMRAVRTQVADLHLQSPALL